MFEIPEGAQPVAFSDACSNQGFLYQDRLLALQCHLEMTPQSLALLIAARRHELVDAPYIQSTDTMLAEPDASYELMQTVLAIGWVGKDVNLQELCHSSLGSGQTFGLPFILPRIKYCDFN